MRHLLVLLLLPSPAICTGQPRSAAENNFLWKGEYRHVHRQPAQWMNEKKYAKVAEWCQAALKKHRGDVMTMWFLGLAKMHLKEDYPDAVGKAIHTCEIPREWLPNELKARHFGIAHGPMLGRVTGNSASFWFRVTKPQKTAVQVEIFPTATGMVPAATGKTIATGGDRTGIVTVNGLKPNTEYYYRLTISGVHVLPKTGRYRFRTAPGNKSVGQFTIAFGGGAAFNPKFARMWKTIHKHRPLAFLFLGDNVYIDAPQDPNYQRYKYYRRQSQPWYRHLAAETAIYSIWDDHDFGKNDCWGGLDPDQPVWKRKVLDVFKENWINPAYGGGKQNPGCWYDFSLGNVHFIMLDGRYYRTPKRQAKGKPPTMLGPAQKAWLKKTLAASKGTFKVICSPVPFIGGNPDKWTGYPQEREEIFSFIEKNRIEGVVLMSADRHRGDLLVTRRKQGYDLYEFMTSKLTNVHTHGTIGEKDGAVFSYNKKNIFGLITFNTVAGEPTVTYQIVTIDGDPVHSFTVTRSQLSFGKR